MKGYSLSKEYNELSDEEMIEYRNMVYDRVYTCMDRMGSILSMYDAYYSDDSKKDGLVRLVCEVDRMEKEESSRFLRGLDSVGLSDPVEEFDDMMMMEGRTLDINLKHMYDEILETSGVLEKGEKKVKVQDVPPSNSEQ